MDQTQKESRASVVIAECLRRAAAGETVEPEQVIAENPECAAELRLHFATAPQPGRVTAGSLPAKPANEAVAASEQPTVSPAAGDSVPNSAASFRKLPSELGRYRVERILGQGAMGAVYLAHDTKLGRDVALKTPKLGNAADPQVVERFQREARAAALLHHRNLCPVYDVGEVQGIHFLTMAYIDGVPLSKAVSKEQPPTERQCAAIVRRLALALQEAHSHGVVHRDLKPANILIDRSREPVVMDFGLAHQLEQTDRSRLTATGVIMGSPAYMSPEQVRGEPGTVGPLTDVYSLGVILFELLTGHLPADGSMLTILAKTYSGERRRIQDIRPGIDAQLAAVCTRMMAQRPRDRFPSMQAVADTLGRWLKDQKRTAAKARVEEDLTSWVVLYEEPLSTDPLPPRQKKRKKRRRKTAETVAQPEREIPPATYAAPQPVSSNHRSRIVPWIVCLVAAIGGLCVLAGAIITLRDGTTIETGHGDRVEITPNPNGGTSVTVQSTNPPVQARSAAAAPVMTDERALGQGELEQAIRLQELKTGKANYAQGETVVVTYEVVNTGNRPIDVPLNTSYSRPMHIVGSLQAWIEPLDADARRTDFGRAKKVGKRFAAGGTILPIQEDRLNPGQRLPRSAEVNAQLQAGRYRYDVEFSSVGGETLLCAESIEFTVESRSQTTQAEAESPSAPPAAREAESPGEAIASPEVICPEQTQVGQLTNITMKSGGRPGGRLQYELRVSKQGGRTWTFEPGQPVDAGQALTYRNNFTVWKAGTFTVQARSSDGTSWSRWSEPQTIVCFDKASESGSKEE